MDQWWKSEPWRIIQTNLREFDMDDINAATYVEQLKRFGATAVMISVGGIVAHYQTRVEDQPVNPHLLGDCLEDVIQACKREGIRVIARVDYSKIRREVYEKHPDWAYRTENGEIVDYNGNVHACLCGDYQQVKAFEITREIAGHFPIDGIFINMGGFRFTDYSYRYYGICHCESCKRKFLERFGLNLPKLEDMHDPVYRKYKIFQRQIMREYQIRMAELLHGINPQIAVDGIDFIRLESNTEYGRREQQWQYDSSSLVRLEQSLSAGMLCSNASVDFAGAYYRHVAVSPAQQSLRMWQTLANLGGLDYYVMGRLDNHEDRSGYRAIQKVFHFHQAHENAFKAMKQYAEALLLHRLSEERTDEARGWIRALTEGHILLHEAEPEMIKNTDELMRYKAVIVAGLASMSDACIHILDGYVHRGGCLIVVGQSGQYDDEGTERNCIPFVSLGKPRVKAVRRDMLSAMFKLQPEEHAIFSGLEDSELVLFGNEYVFVGYPDSAKRYLRLIPPHRYGPPEMCYYSQITELPGFVVNEYGKGRIVHITCYPGTEFYQEGYENTYSFLQGILTGIAGLRSVEGKPFSRMAEVTLSFDTNGRALVQLVNASGHFGVSFIEAVPMTELELRLPIPFAPNTVTCLTNGCRVPFEWHEGELILTVERLNDYEALLIEKGTDADRL